MRDSEDRRRIVLAGCSEVMLDAVGADANTQIEKFHGGRGGYGRYTYRYRHTGEASPELQLLRELEEAGAGWSPLLGGLFGDNADRATAALEEVSQIASRISSERW